MKILCQPANRYKITSQILLRAKQAYMMSFEIHNIIMCICARDKSVKHVARINRMCVHAQNKKNSGSLAGVNMQ